MYIRDSAKDTASQSEHAQNLRKVVKGPSFKTGQENPRSDCPRQVNFTLGK